MNTPLILVKRAKSGKLVVRCAEDWKQKVEIVAALTGSDYSKLARTALDQLIDRLAAENPVIRSHVTR